MALAFDRFEVGLGDSQAATVFGECTGCGGEIYIGDMFYEFTDATGKPVICHGDSACLETAVGAELLTAGD